MSLAGRKSVLLALGTAISAGGCASNHEAPAALSPPTSSAQLAPAESDPGDELIDIGSTHAIPVDEDGPKYVIPDHPQP